MNPYGDWLRLHPWSYFATLTYRTYRAGSEGVRRVPSPDTALKHWERIADDALPASTQWVTVVERGGLHGRVHLHSLLACQHPSDISLAVPMWDRRHGIGWWYRYRPELGAAGYTAKYLTKEMAAWSLGGNWTSSAVAEPRALRTKDGALLGMRPRSEVGPISSPSSGDSIESSPENWQSWKVGSVISWGVDSESLRATGLSSAPLPCKTHGIEVIVQDW